MADDLQRKIEQAVKLIQSAGKMAEKKGQPVEICYSGGKDSDVILELARMANVNYCAIYKNTTIDPPLTLKHCKENNVKILQPKKSFIELVKEKGMPTRRARFCCEMLKEYKVYDVAVQGIRRSESTARAKRYKQNEPIICRIYGSKKNHVNVVLPILTWTDKDVTEFINERHIKCHPLYYDKKGNFHVERRLGCIGCPLKSDAGVGDFLKYPKLLKKVVNAVGIWFATHPRLRSIKKFQTPYGLVAHNLFYNTLEEWEVANDGLFGKTDWKSKLENYFHITL